MNDARAKAGPFKRYALYAAPAADSPLGVFGNAWLGRDPANQLPLAYPALPGYTAARIAALTGQPAKYGFHATLKPPFQLAGGMSVEQLSDALTDMTGSLAPVAVGKLSVSAIGTFVALVPDAAPPDLAALAATLVRDLDRFRAPPELGELARRRQAALTARQESHLVQWGYPYVMEDFRFHFTLSGSLARADQEALSQALQIYTKDKLPPYRIDDIALFGEPADGTGFHLLRRFPLKG